MPEKFKFNRVEPLVSSFLKTGNFHAGQVQIRFPFQVYNSTYPFFNFRIEHIPLQL